MNLHTRLLVSLLFILGCNSSHLTEDPKNWSQDQVSQWFNQKDWLGQTELQPDSSINKREFAIQYYKNKKRWDKAFSFLENEDLSALKIGVQELDGKNVFVKVTEYYLKDPPGVPFELHKNYADIHYVISGVENIGSADISAASERTQYDSIKDIQFYNADKSENHFAQPGTFFIFFSNELHRQGLRVKDSALVKKIVVKIRN